MDKPILFIDFYKTLNFDAYWRSLPLEELQKIQTFLFHNRNTLVDDWMRGKHTAEQINKIGADKLDIPYELLWNIFVEDCKTTTIHISILEKIRKLRSKHIVILITDNMDSFTRFILPELKLEDYFDAISNSYEQGLLKSDNSGELFLKYTKLNNVNIEDCVCLDDSQNVYETFTKLGGTAYLVTLEQDVSYFLEKIN